MSAATSPTPSPTPSPAIAVRGLRLGSGKTTLVDGIDLTVESGHAVGIVGESGSGKSLTLRAIIGLLPRGVEQLSGTVEVEGHAGLVFQDPLSALDPLIPVGKQVIEVCRFTAGLSKTAARARALELFTEVGIPDPEQRLGWYPHELSGGQRQRVVIALALAAEPDVLLCDEPTTALDVTVQAQVLALLERLRVTRGLTLLFVSHDIAVVSSVCSRIIVMKDGTIVEQGTTDDILSRPVHNYTKMLLDSVLELPVPAVELPTVTEVDNG
jgi:peptide/nickel transport system ATP-binding protein